MANAGRVSALEMVMNITHKIKNWDIDRLRKLHDGIVCNKEVIVL